MRYASKADPRLPQDIAYIYEILHCNQFIILSNATAYETTTIIRVSQPCGGFDDPSSLICSGIAENDEVVAMEDVINVGNILGKFLVSLWSVPHLNNFEHPTCD